MKYPKGIVPRIQGVGIVHEGKAQVIPIRTFFCIGCGQEPCIKKCEELCPHGVMIRDLCEECFIKEFPNE